MLVFDHPWAHGKHETRVNEVLRVCETLGTTEPQRLIGLREDATDLIPVEKDTCEPLVPWHVDVREVDRSPVDSTFLRHKATGIKVVASETPGSTSLQHAPPVPTADPLAGSVEVRLPGGAITPTTPERHRRRVQESIALNHHNRRFRNRARGMCNQAVSKRPDPASAQAQSSEPACCHEIYNSIESGKGPVLQGFSVRSLVNVTTVTAPGPASRADTREEADQAHALRYLRPGTSLAHSARVRSPQTRLHT